MPETTGRKCRPFPFLRGLPASPDNCSPTIASNFPLFFSLHLPHFMGFKLAAGYSDSHPYLDLSEGGFVERPPEHPHYLEGELARQMDGLLKVMQTDELDQFRMNRETRRKLLHACLAYYQLHLPSFTPLKTLSVLEVVL